MNMNRYKDHKEAQKELERIFNQKNSCLFIHYSCESFYDIPNGATPRITAIAVKHYGTNQTTSFSIHKVAELKHIAFEEITSHYDELEKEMLKEFFSYVEKHSGYTWVHWNMRNIVYGFQAIEHRYKVLGGKPSEIADERKVDLSLLLIKMYGIKYIGHPRLEKLKELNKISYLGYLSGKEEATSFQNGEYVKLYSSTVSKVDLLMNIVERMRTDELKTNAKWKEIYGVSIQGIFQFLNSKWWFRLVVSLLSLFAGGLIGYFLNIWMG